MKDLALLTKFRIFLKEISRGISSDTSPLEISLRILSGQQQLPDFMTALDLQNQYYWIGNIYAALIVPSKKKELAAYFTPPPIANYIIKRSEQHGLNIVSSRILDPASGGAAFLTPLSAAIIRNLRMEGAIK